MYVKVTVTPGAKRERVDVKSPTHLVISVKEPAKQNLANRRVIELIARHYAVTKNKVRMVSGHRSRNKVLSVY
ncbi:MAG: DUF167 domain-containing protein [Patescibacteria group bacterium]